MTRTLKCNLVNKSASKALNVREKKAEAGQFIGDPPGSVSARGGTTVWTLTSDGDIRGEVVFYVPGATAADDENTVFSVQFEDPTSGGGTYRVVRRERSPDPSASGTTKPIQVTYYWETTADASETRELTFVFEDSQYVPSAPREGGLPGVIEVMAACGQRNQVRLPATARKAMIAPDGNLSEVRRRMLNSVRGRASCPIPDQSRGFADQWQGADPINRRVFEVPRKGRFEDFVAQTKSAAQWATGGEIILLVGHGASAGFRGAKMTAFDTIPETGAMSAHRHMVTSEVLFDLHRLAERQADGTWEYKKQAGGTQVSGGVFGSGAQLADLGRKWDLLGDLGDELQRRQVVLFTVASCNVGRRADKRGDDVNFGGALAQRLKVGVRLYLKLLAMGEVLFSPGEIILEQAWLTTDEDHRVQDQPPSDNPKAASFHEVPDVDYQIWDPFGKPCASG